MLIEVACYLLHRKSIKGECKKLPRIHNEFLATSFLGFLFFFLIDQIHSYNHEKLEYVSIRLIAVVPYKVSSGF